MIITSSKISQNNSPLVSVIINCFNGERYLAEAIESVIAQSYENWELIFWDNQSTDNSANIFKAYNDKRCRYFFAPNYTTLGLARNLAVEKARGEWVSFLDCDDLWLIDKLQKQVDIINHNRSDLAIIYGRSRIVVEPCADETYFGKNMVMSESDYINRSLPEGYIFEHLLRECFISLVTALIKRSAYWEVGGIDPIYKQAEDYDIFLKVAQRYKASAVNNIISVYRIHSSNMSHDQEVTYIESIQIIKKYLPTFSAAKALKYHQTYHAIYKIRNGNKLDGIILLLRHGSIRVFIYRLSVFLKRLVKNSIWAKICKGYEY